MKSNYKLGITLMILCTIFTAVGQYFFKISSASFSFDLAKLLTNYNLIFGFMFYGFGAILMIVAFRFGNLSKLYPLVSLNFIWVAIISVVFLGEKMNSFKINAIILVVLGIILIGGSK